jgi:hypothetical protein
MVMAICVGCGKHSYTERKMKIQFTDYSDDMKKEFTFTDFEGDLVLNYSQFSLETGCFVFQLCEGDQVEEESRFYSGDPSTGEIVFNGLKKDNEYTFYLFAENAYRGCIQIEW